MQFNQLGTDQRERAAVQPAPPAGTDQQAYIRANCYKGLPLHAANWRFGQTEYATRRGYVLEFSGEDQIPLWVCERVTKSTVPKSDVFSFFGRDDKWFIPDESIVIDRVNNEDYSDSGYQRGHMAPAGNQACTDRKKETFRLSNVAPQQKGLNLGAWAELDDKVRNHVRKTGTDVFVIHGTLFWELAEESSESADGQVTHYQIGENRISVPTHFFKIVVWKEQSSMKCAAVVVDAVTKSVEPRSVRWVEQRTGLIFFPELSPPELTALGHDSGDVPEWLHKR